MRGSALFLFFPPKVGEDQEKGLHVRRCRVYVRRCRVYVRRCRVHVRRCCVHVRRCRVHVRGCRVHVRRCRVHVRRCRVFIENIGEDQKKKIFVVRDEVPHFLRGPRLQPA